VGRIQIDPRQFPKEPSLARLILELTRRVDGILNHVCCKDADGIPYSVYWVHTESVSDEELSRQWDEVWSEHRSSVHWGAGERKKRRR
jgi:hypothetical protein